MLGIDREDLDWWLTTKHPADLKIKFRRDGTADRWIIERVSADRLVRLYQATEPVDEIVPLKERVAQRQERAA